MNTAIPTKPVISYEHVNPMRVRKDDKIVTKFGYGEDGNRIVAKTRAIKHSKPCGHSPEKWHLDHECYDVRFSTVPKVK